MNTAYFGDGFYGIYDASHGYYNKDPKDLNLDEASMLAGVPNAPSLYSPNVNLNLAKRDRLMLLRKCKNMVILPKNRLYLFFLFLISFTLILILFVLYFCFIFLLYILFYVLIIIHICFCPFIYFYMGGFLMF